MKKKTITYLCLICFVLITGSCYEQKVKIESNNTLNEDNKEHNEMKNNSKNHLQYEKSPYLLQHAANPVDWYPWGDEAFEKARKEDKPIFLSIGYSTCHWCHVMEHESFEDKEVAELLNKSFVSIKVDREERPAIDHIYMTAAQVMTGSGGWPLTIVMTPDKKPFFAGTYFPKNSRFNRIGLTELLPQISDAWKNKRDEILKSADHLTNVIQNVSSSNHSGPLPDNISRITYNIFKKTYDSEYGGFRENPKFPTPHQLLFLLRYWQKTKEKPALDMVENTLQKMRNGGIFDHVGFGFHRYSTDREWLVPHFEKMLYDQALLMMAYTEAYEATGKKEYAEVVNEIFIYISRDMTGTDGGFYTAEDADSEGEEGKFYVWTSEELNKILSPEEFQRVQKYFNITKSGNYEVEATRRKNGTNIPHISKSGDPDRSKAMADIREKLFQYREKRIHPLKDTKILADWNGLMIAALAKAGRAMEKKEYTISSEKAAAFVLSKMKEKDGTLLHRYKDGSAEITGKLEDYTSMVWGLLELYQSTFKMEYLKSALELNKVVFKHFKDEKNGGLFLTADYSEKLIIRPKEIYDGAIPSGNSVAVLNLFKLAAFTGDNSYSDKAIGIADSFSASLKQTPTGHTMLLIALLFESYPAYEIVVSAPLNASDSDDIIKLLNGFYFPAKVLLLRQERADGKIPEICKIVESVKVQVPIDGNTTLYMCNSFGCLEPITTAKELRKILKKITETANSD